MRSLLAVLCMLILAGGLVAGEARAEPDPGGVDAYLESIRDDPGRLREFLRDLPKGADLHTHLSGAASTASLVGYAVRDGLCIDKKFQASAPPCRPDQRPAGDTQTDPDFYDDIVRAWSMSGFIPGRESGHDHFFDAFKKFGPASDHKGEMLAEVVSRAAAQNESYLEILMSRRSVQVMAIAKRIGLEDADRASRKGLVRMRQRLLADPEMTKIIDGARADTDTDFGEMRGKLRCGAPAQDRACGMPVRLDYQVPRATDPEIVFTHLLLGFELAERDPRYVGVNLVQPEDHKKALRDYRLHMRMLGYLRGLYKKAHITLHAGELAPGLAPEEHLRFHIREAVQVGRAERIGHGTAVAHEDDADGLLREMARRHVLVEIPLSSNCQILEVCGRESPLGRYREAGVPVALATDDEGIEHTDLTSEYVRAVQTFGLRYADLKTLARASLDHGFLQGQSLWRGRDDFRPAAECAGQPSGSTQPGARCQALLTASEKATAEWRQEAAFADFEDRYGG